MSAYFTANLKIHNHDEYNEYRALVPGSLEKYNGKYLALNKSPEILEGEWGYSLFVLLEFPDMESLKKWYYSDEYQEILKLRLASAKADVLITEGLRA